ncbi:farnesyl-diphosphate synthase [Pelagirhabdus alkalitolerans]|uniref:Farnesyl diphosphate synthase n=1 Tax=Pelagirhabdus alkalitolerans TaxID=1612202 RepID=A0A1G6I274_9BACI|nr:farnesyl diphosphate synthase [Pelagirhabdus alkalitolerans]SDC00518.1 farnesyl-diphosphate synthase [Pelagirhabdus alkalitolerans]
METKLNEYIQKNQTYLNQALEDAIEDKDIPEPLKSSMLYSIKAGGKRIRPILMIATIEAFGGDKNVILPAALALEFVHTYSLIHDDLPAMDDDDLRRGMPTNHIEYDEATAILAGDGLLTQSFELITNAEHLTTDQKLFAVKRLSEAAGSRGMVAGQILDMQAENTQVELDELKQIHHLKTGQLLIYAMEIAAYVAGATEEQLDKITACAEELGLLFQIQDDILDIYGDEDKIGKAVGSDEENDKSTYPKLLGIDGAIKEKEEKKARANKLLNEASIDQTMLAELIQYLSNRDQ